MEENRLSSLFVNMCNIIYGFLFAAFCAAFLALEVGAFTGCGRSSGVLRSQKYHTRTNDLSRLYAVADPPFSPAEYEKQRSGDDDDDGNGGPEWTATEGGFFANFAKPVPGKVGAIETVDNIQDYKRVVVDEKDRMVVVRFHAAWCRSCKASEPFFKRLVNKHSPHIKFVQVPLTKETAYLQEGLGVPSVPFAHIYHPEVGLVEEQKVSKPHFKEFENDLNSYVVGSCKLPNDDDDADPFDASRSQENFQ